MEPIQRGYILLADLSGFTSFVADSEVDHAPAILRNLISFLDSHLSPILTIAEVEGDAVFAFARDSDVSRGELLIELIERTYVDFRDMQRTMVFNATCDCRACMAVPSLDLKFIVHHGEFVLQHVQGRDKPVGASVILAHRLLKNDVSDVAGWRGYALFSTACLEAMDVHFRNGCGSSHDYPHLGRLDSVSIDLDARYEDFTRDRFVKLEDTNAHFLAEYELTAPPPIIWDWIVDPHKRTTWNPGSDWAILERPLGRTGIQSRHHCRASGAIECILDLRPFEYLTVRQEMGPFRATVTQTLAPTGRGTRVRVASRLEWPLPAWTLRKAASLAYRSLFEIDQSYALLEERTANWNRPTFAEAVS